MKLRLMMLLLALPLLGGQMSVQAADMDMLACAPQTGKVEKGSFPLKAGEPILFSCTVTNPTGEEFSGMLLGKQFFGDQSQGASSSDVKIEKDGTSEATLQFPALFVSGKYRFTFVVMDQKTKAAASKEVVLNGVLGGEAQPSIMSASIANGTYSWGDAFDLMLTLTVPKGTTLDNQAVMFDATMVDQNGQACGTVASGHVVTQATNTYSLTLPKQGSCTNNGLLLTLKNTTGTVIDTKTLALNLPVAQVPAQPTPNQPGGETTGSSSLTIFMVTIMLTVVLIAALFGYFVMKRRP